MKIWLALLAAPILMLADQSIAYAITGWSCAQQQHTAVHFVHLVFLASTVVVTALAWQLWRTMPRGAADEREATRFFLSGLAIASGAFSALVIGAMWYASFAIAHCFG